MRNNAQTITSANSILLARVKGVFDNWVKIEGFAADDAFTSGQGGMAETQIGVDGLQSAGWTPYETPFDIALQANSASRSFFKAVVNAQDKAQEVLRFEFSIELPSVKERYMLSGYLTESASAQSAKKVLQPLKYSFKTIVETREDI